MSKIVKIVLPIAVLTALEVYRECKFLKAVGISPLRVFDLFKDGD